MDNKYLQDKYKNEDIKLSTEPDDIFTYLDLCSGLGGFHQGVSKVLTKSKSLMGCDINKNCRQTYYMNYGVPCHKDITQLNETWIHPNNVRVDGIFGGFPCQPFSQSGKKEGVEDQRGTIIYNIFFIVEQYKPKYILLENVLGILQHKHSELLEYIKNELNRMGYNLKIEKSNPLWLGIPHNRPRVMFMGIRKDLPFNIPDIVKKPHQKLWDIIDQKDTKNNLSDKQNQCLYLIEKYIETCIFVKKPRHIYLGFLRDKDNQDGLNKSIKDLIKKNLKQYEQDKEFKTFIDNYLEENDIEGLTTTQLILEFNGETDGVFDELIIQQRPSGFRIRQRDYVPTLTKGGMRPIIVYNNIIRTLNDKEMLKLQSFPEDFKYNSSSSLTNQIGNSVNCNVVENCLNRMIGFVDFLNYL